VQTENRGRDNPVLESLVYIGGTVIARKRTPYADKLTGGASEEMIASLLKRQHQVIIAAIKAGRIEDLVRLSSTESNAAKEAESKRPAVTAPTINQRPTAQAPIKTLQTPAARASTPLEPEAAKPAISAKPTASGPLNLAGRGETKSLDIDKVISDYLKKNEEQARLDLKVLTPDVFIAGRSIGLRLHVTSASKSVADAIVTIKVIGTAFKPQVYIGRAGKDGIANFSLTLPSFNAGTAAIVIEAQAGESRGELKHLIRRA
jgi:hypothetical protein